MVPLFGVNYYVLRSIKRCCILRNNVSSNMLGDKEHLNQKFHARFLHMYLGQIGNAKN